jgi:hypothetical protein
LRALPGFVRWNERQDYNGLGKERMMRVRRLDLSDGT